MWDERCVLPVSVSGSTLAKLEYNVQNLSVEEHLGFETSPYCRRKRFLNNKALRESVHVLPQLWKPDVCADILGKLHEEMKRLNKGWYTKRHAAYSTVDLPLYEIPKLDHNIRRFLRKHLMVDMARRFGFEADDLFFKDLFFVKYEVRSADDDDDDGREEMQAGLELHRDGSVLSFNVLLNPKSEFQGGGTYFKHTDKTVEINQGDCVVHSGTVLHAGRNITRGRRYLLVGFVESNPSRVPSALRNLFSAPLMQIAELEAKATAKRETENASRESISGGGAQLDVEEDVMRMLCLS